MKTKLVLITVIITFLSAVSSWANNNIEIDQVITSIVVKKSDRKMYLFNGEKVLRRYRIGLGFSPKGDKKIEGDGKTPEGKYYICLLYTSPSPRDVEESRMPSSA